MSVRVQPEPRDLTKREQRSAESRRRILNAAVEQLIETGFAGATTSAIQEKAGVSRGRLLHHFPSREELLVAAAEHLATERVDAATSRAAVAADPSLGIDERIRQTVEFMWLTFSEPHFWASVELWTAARTNEWVADAIRPFERKLGQTIRDSIDGIWGAPIVDHPQYPLMRDLLFTSMRGSALAYTFDRRDPRTDPHLDQWVATVHLLLDIDR